VNHQRLAVALCLVLLAACHAHGKAKTDDRMSVDRLYPLRQDAVWSYDVDTGEGLPILAITRVTKVEAQRVEMSVAGRQSIAYERREQGLFRPDCEAFVLLAPVRAGESWDACGKATAEVRSVEKDVSTPAGEFHGCVEIVETGAAGGKVTRTVYCPDVGPVEVESTMPVPQGGGELARVIARLRGFDLSGNAGK
jgi:hypothetical protein